MGHVMSPIRAKMVLRRREMLVQGSKVAAGIGVAVLLGNLGASRGNRMVWNGTMSLLDSLTPARTALLVIDMQRDFLLPEGYAAQAGLDIAPWSRPSAQSESCSLWGEQPDC